MTGSSTGPGNFVVVVGPGLNSTELHARLGEPSIWPDRSPSAREISLRDVGGTAFFAWTGSGEFAERDGRGCVGQFDLQGVSEHRDADGALAVLEGRFSGRDARGVPDGSFVYASVDSASGTLEIGTDRFRTRSLYHATRGEMSVVATDLRLLAASGIVVPELSLRAVYHFLNFSYVPTPFTMLDGVYKVPRASVARIGGGRVDVARYWHLTYAENRDVADVRQAAAELREQAAAAALRSTPGGGERWGAFLSGGTDSSSIAGMLARAGGEPVHTFSIGFAEPGYDELEYARVAARHFGLVAHTHVVSADEALRLLPDVLDAYDEPPGNASSLPTFACARLGQSMGMTTLIGGDGGDEIFGGNERYRKDAILQAFFRLPAFAKRSLGMLADVGESIDWRPWNRVRNFVRRGSIPNPDRFYTDDAFASEYFGTLLGPAFRGAVGADDSLNHMREVYARIEAPSELHRLMELDLEMTIADNDIVKVSRAVKACGMAVRFPYLDRRLVEYAGTLPASAKVRRGEKRFLFKRAMSDVLPDEILRKKKQGFGLPTAVWFREHPGFRAMLDEVLLGRRTQERGLFETQQIRSIVRRHEKGAWDHGAEIWYLLVLELWIRKYLEPAAA
jgi:asparagine synthase (glutamine-hydrolysing)